MFTKNESVCFDRLLYNSFYWPKSEGDFNNGNKDVYFDSVLDGDPVVKTFNNFTVVPNTTVSVKNRCKGLYLNILGDCIIDGTLSMTGKGCAGDLGLNVGIEPLYGVFYSSEVRNLNIMGIKNENIVPKYSNNYNQEPLPRQNGYGGYSQIDMSSAKNFVGAVATAFAGGTGAGGWPTNSGYYPSIPVIGGLGGNGGYVSWWTGYGTAYHYSGGGAGFPGGSYNNAQTGAGGLIILIVHGDFIVNLNGKIVNNGMNGGSKYGDCFEGGGSGGGSINIFHRGEYKNHGLIQSKGGSLNGGSGQITITKF